MTLGRKAVSSGSLAFLLALVFYSFAAGPTLFRQSIAPHYVYLAGAMLHGQLYLEQPPSSYDLLVVDERAYVAGSPMPAILLMPVVAVFGVGVSDILFGVVAGALNVALVQAIFRRGWLTLLFAFGTPHLYLASLGSVWFNAHVVAVLFGLLSVRAILSAEGLSATETQRHGAKFSVLPWIRSAGRWFFAGLLLACAGFARPTMLFASSFFVVLIWRAYAGRERFRPFVAFGVAIALGLAAHGLYNAARFGSPADFGYQYAAGAPNITSAYLQYGGFNPRFVPCNLFVSIANPPEINGYVPPILYDLCSYLLDGVNLSDPSALIAPNPLGMSLFIVTPAFALLFAARQRDSLARAAWLGLLATMIPLWMYHNTGSLQFGYRYWMDAAPMWLLLLARISPGLARRGSAALDLSGDMTPSGYRGTADLSRENRRRASLAWALLLISVVINVWGFLWMFLKFSGAGRL
ncbi:MAG TPA: hypothetical protein VFL17_01330 [Anaerolineae bacterium]|nr:hypothetical protein [Anaerolineae bacterium]